MSKLASSLACIWRKRMQCKNICRKFTKKHSKYTTTIHAI